MNTKLKIVLPFRVIKNLPIKARRNDRTQQDEFAQIESRHIQQQQDSDIHL